MVEGRFTIQAIESSIRLNRKVKTIRTRCAFYLQQPNIASTVPWCSRSADRKFTGRCQASVEAKARTREEKYAFHDRWNIFGREE